MASRDEPRLIRVDTPERAEFPIGQGTTRIGRSRGVDICLEDRAVSRFHCYLQRDGMTVRIFDGESKNPARVNGEEACGQVLRSGHSIRIGHCELVYEGPLPPGEPSPRATKPAEAETLSPRRELRPAPRRAYAGRGRARSGAPVGWIVTGLILCPCIAWLLLVQLPRSLERAAPPREASDTSAAQLRRLETELASLRAELAGKTGERAPSKAETERTAALSRRIKDLETELARQWSDTPPAGANAPATPAPSTTPTAVTALPDAELDSAEEVASVEDLRQRQSGKTVIVKDTNRRVERDPKDIRELAARVKARLDDYATHLISPQKLDPELRELSLSLGKTGAEAMLEVCDHAWQLLRVVDASIASNERQRSTLLRKAQASVPPAPAGPAPKAKDRPAHERPAGSQTETDQRLLELFTKAAAIHRHHRQALLPLRRATLAALERLTDPEAARRLRARFVDEFEDDELCAAIALALKGSGLREHVPSLYKRLGVTRNATLRQALHGALVALTGKDLGETAPAWAQWWTQQGER